MPFGWDTRVIPSNTVLDGASVSHGKGRFGGQNLQFAAMPPRVELLWPFIIIVIIERI